jgi:AhpD family alkylhydroperoxidase
MNAFRRRIYHTLGGFITDLRYILNRRKNIHVLMRGDILDPKLRERIMLVVTSVNRCRYCSYAHSREALSMGISKDEIEELGKGMFKGSPADELSALLYAQHWAEKDGQPEEIIRSTVVEKYGMEKVKNMELAMRMIRVGNLLGNTGDYILYKLSFGRLGK